MITTQITDGLAVLDRLRGELERALKALDAGRDPLRHQELAAALDEVMVASANLRVLLPRPVPGNAAARFAAAVEAQREHQNRRSSLMQGVVDGDGPPADRAASRP
jgi:hypothetical protein